ncbi:methylated-DNA--[protein]-cysteine S-methyltransferase [Rothia halotolerans]|uniref:methylated-DNA--[protein]-cysteine S-methyltransferase n=1 Tax=Rothia halotolerans TaxID=405770 RepID=UPI00101C4DBA|nr:methylated-DNA--[protein]-cysteine S-methyltransferase [Rothia halotolerans]
MIHTPDPEPRHAALETPLGSLLCTARGEALTGLYFPGHRHPPGQAELGPSADAAGDPLLEEAGRQLREYLEGRRRDFDLPLSPRGDEFSLRVWELLRQIPFGETTTYGALAERMGNRHLAQRVGQVVGRNPLSVVIPCHRVVGADGSLTGYAGGLDRKRILLELEEPAHAADARLF